MKKKCNLLSVMCLVSHLVSSSSTAAVFFVQGSLFSTQVLSLSSSFSICISSAFLPSKE